MTYQAELQQQRDELSQLVSNKTFISDFQKANYNLLITNYWEPADNSARDYDNNKKQYDKWKDKDANKASQYKAKMDKAENELKPNKDALKNLKIEISNMEQILTKLTEINTKLDNIKTTPSTSTPDLSNLATKEDINEVKTNINNIKITPTDLTNTNTKIEEVKSKIDNIKFPNVDFAPTNTKIDNLLGKVENIKLPTIDLTNTNQAIQGLGTKIDSIKPVDLTNTNNQIQGIGTKLDNLKLPNLDLTEPNKKLDDIKKILLNGKDKRNADLVIKGNKNITDFEAKQGGKYPTFTTDPEQFFKGISEEKQFYHVLLRQDPNNKLWGVVYTSTDQGQIYWFSPNADWTNERTRADAWQKAQGSTRALSTWGDKWSKKYNNTDQQFSLVWVLGFLAYSAQKLNAGETMNWDDLTNESIWRPLGEAELKKYDN